MASTLSSPMWIPCGVSKRPKYYLSFGTNYILKGLRERPTVRRTLSVYSTNWICIFPRGKWSTASHPWRLASYYLDQKVRMKELLFVKTNMERVTFQTAVT